jgi:hypothetical protein
MKRVILLTLVVGIAAAATGNASAAETHSNCIQFDGNGNVIGLTPNCTQTVSQKGGTPMQMPTVDPCTGETGVLTLAISHQIYHINVNGADDAWDTGTMNGMATFAPDDGTGPTAQGSWVNWFGDSFNAKNLVQHFTFNLALQLSNGQKVTFHETAHMSFTPNGPAVSFDKVAASCS